MKQKTKQKIVDYIGENFQLQGRLNKNQRLAVWAGYILQPFIFHIVLLASIAQSQFQFPYSQGFELGIVLTRIAVALVYIYTNWIYIIPAIKILQIANVYMLRTNFSSLALLFELMAQIVYTAKKQKRYVNFDSRLQSKFFGAKVFTIYILLLATFFTSQQQIYKSPSSVLFTSVIFYIASCLDTVFSYKTKEILRTLALCPIMMAIYFLCEPLVPALNTFGLVAHTIVSVVIMALIIIYAIVSDYTYHNPILFKKIINLESRDKLAYIWALVCFVQAPTYNELVCFIKTHQSKCFNPLCPLNSSLTHTSHLQQQAILKSLKLYLKKCLQRFASQSDQIRRLFIYYRQQDDPKITYLLKQNDIFQKIQQQRIVRNLNTVTDPSLQYQQMKQIQQETFMKVKLFLNHYEYFLSYISKEVIKMETSEEIIDELLKLKTYFLSFKANSHHDKDGNQQQLAQAKSSNKVIKNAQGYQQISTETVIPLKKMTVKTVLLVNFMRQVYFNLPSLQKEEFNSKKINYISEDIEQGAIIVISAQSYNLGKVMNWNTMTQKVLLFPTKELRQRYVNDLIPQPLHKQHQEILMRGALRIEMNEPAKQLSTKIFTFTKPSYIVVFQTKIVGTNSISGNKWIIHLQQHFDRQCVIVVDEYRNIVGVNKNAVRFDLGLECVGEQLDEEVFERVIKGKKDKVILAVGVEPVPGIKLDKQTQWELADTTYALQGMPKYFIVEIQATYEIERAALSRHGKLPGSTAVSNIQQNIFPLCDNGFELNFDPCQLKYTNQPISAYSSTDLQLVWQQNWQYQQRTYNQDLFQQFQQTHQRNKLINFGENIHQMIYFDQKLQFKENFQVSTEFQTHPSYKPGGKMVVNNRGVFRIDINKENFVENVNKIKNKVPSFVYKMAILIIVLSTICVACLTLRLIYFNNLYSASQQQQLISMQVINRKNYIVNIGSLAVYLATNRTYPTIWVDYLTNGWSFENLFVGIEYTNGEINSLNGNIGLLVNKGYLLNGTTKTLASYFESLSIQASSWTTGNMNLTQFISQIVNDVSTLQYNIALDIQSYYQNQYSSYQNIVLIIDIVQFIICILTFVFMHLFLRKAYRQRVHLFKSLTVIQQQEIQKILSTINQHREHIKNNQLQSIPLEDNYKQATQTQNIKHQKKMLFSYFSSKIVLFYIFIAINIVGAGFIFLLSNHSYTEMSNIQLITPFVNITGEQRYSMGKLFLKTITNTETDPENALLNNIRMFQFNKKGVIDSLIAQSFSSSFMTFYNTIWFSPCSTLQVAAQCASLFSGIHNANLDYNYVYILTEIQKVVDYRTQIAASNSTQFISDANSQIVKSYKRINFLLFDLMIKLQAKFLPNLQSQINYLYKVAQNDNLVIFIVSIIWVIILALILAYTLYKIKNLSSQTLQMLTTVVPSCILMRNEYFVEWYQEKFRNVY